MNKLITMLRLSAEADKAKALLSLDLLGNKAVGIGDHLLMIFTKTQRKLSLFW
jgi:hypothetical protein